MKRAHDLAWQLNLTAEQTPDTVLHLQARHALWTSALFSADWSGAVRYAREGLALYDAHQHHASAGRYGGHDPGICAHGIGAMGLWFIGQPDTALDMSLAGIRLAENLGHRVSLAHALEFGGMLRGLRREIDILKEYANTVVALGEELEEDRYQATGSLLAAWALSQRDRVVEPTPISNSG